MTSVIQIVIFNIHVLFHGFLSYTQTSIHVLIHTQILALVDTLTHRNIAKETTKLNP